MLSKLLSSVLMHLVSGLLNAITDWMRQKELEALRDKKATLEGQKQSMIEAGADEKKIEKVVEKVATTNARAQSIRDKLRAMAEHADREAGEDNA